MPISICIDLCNVFFKINYCIHSVAILTSYMYYLDHFVVAKHYDHYFIDSAVAVVLQPFISLSF